MKFIHMLVLVFLLSACTSTTKLTPESYQIDIDNKYPAIGLLVNGGHHIDSGCYANTCYDLHDRTPEYVSREFSKSKNFNGLFLDNSELDWIVDVNLGVSKRFVEGSGGATLAAMALTLGVVPTTAKHEYEAYIQILYKGVIVKEYEYIQLVDEINSVFVDVQSSDSDAAMLLMAKFFKEIEQRNPFEY
ncbi:hypothetical protein [Shewanella sp. YLB-07]|uniref:hypothetical protein n=1 Tax=Shewanella sp. YLB-07 TaxID=2601268 RepID=UPI00128E931D|nr:hypothetical protein [Shewanella sp. YLB-07]MPY26195.1 hypothetical protein [Shewanella sp. YLB-07]